MQSALVSRSAQFRLGSIVVCLAAISVISHHSQSPSLTDIIVWATRTRRGATALALWVGAAAGFMPLSVRERGGVSIF